MIDDAPPPSAAPRDRTPLGVILLLVLLIAYILYNEVIPRFRTPAVSRVVTPRGDLSEEEKSVIALFQSASPAVVYITNVGVRRSGMLGLNVTEIPQGTGSGFIWDNAGHVVTNFHVIAGAQALDVTLNDHSTWRAKLVGAEPDKDLAVLRIDAPSDRLVPLAVGSSGDLVVGQTVLAIGNPFGLDQTLTSGLVSALGRSIQSATGRTITDVIQTDAAINPGNSGGPLLDSAGRLIGVNTAIYSSSGASAGIGFAVPVDTVMRVVPQLIEHGQVIRPRLGIELAADHVMKQLRREGALILNVQPDSGAADAGLSGTYMDKRGRIILGDIIVAIDGERIANADQLLNRLEHHKVGDAVDVTVIRDDRELTVTVKLR